MFRLAIITPSETIPDEPLALTAIGRIEEVHALHLRKPEWNRERTRVLLDSLPTDVRKKIRLHDHFDLCREYELQGIHLNARNPLPPTSNIPCSASCHTIEELAGKKEQCDYLFLSPIFDSISKQGYRSRFSENELAELARQGYLDRQVFALGGIRTAHIPLLKQLGFGGVGMIGSIWNDYKQNGNMENLFLKIRNILELCQE